MSQIGERLRDARAKAGLTQEGLARAADLSLPTVQRVEAGRHAPSLTTLLALTAALGVDLESIVGGAPEASSPAGAS